MARRVEWNIETTQPANQSLISRLVVAVWLLGLFIATVSFPSYAEFRQITPAYSGSWYDPSTDGEGFNFEFMQDGTGIVYFVTYTDDEQMWLVGVGETVKYGGGNYGFSVGELFFTDGGHMRSLSNPEKVKRHPSGIAVMVMFESCSKGMAMLLDTASEEKITGFNIKRITPADTFGCKD